MPMQFDKDPEKSIRQAIELLKENNQIEAGDPVVILSDVLNQDFDTEAILLRKA